ncbi:hypothetical protein GCM10010987_37660 [Bradyrhizobium guangdongense]|uniref:Uncharacterized protein n=1 Tax=Bradyrhizobium guangdongense TaxID=1325090 RepID=A0AA88B8V2_9BRAD|nr:hypothetical protein GCM10010987_37660 [Bradyrhizobium guangdongense]
MLAALESNDGAEHGKPKEENTGEFVGPDDGGAEYVSAYDSCGQDCDFGQDE